MKLDNKGWGLATMLLCVGAILIFLLIAVFFSLRLNAMIEQNIIKNEDKIDYKYFYLDKINDITVATNNYLEDEEIELIHNSYVRVDLDTLVYLNYMRKVYDPISDEECSAYSISTLDENNIKDIKVFIKCDNYESEGY